MKSSVSVELDVSTSEDSVDIEAESNQDDHHRDQERGKPLEHGRDDEVVAIFGDQFGRREQPSEAAEEVAAARDDKGEQRRDDHAFIDRLFAADGVELLHHLRQAPGAEAGQQHNAQQTGRVGAEEGSKHARRSAGRRVGHLRQTVQRGKEAALPLKHRVDDCADATIMIMPWIKSLIAVAI